jgi:hypothetical protein
MLAWMPIETLGAEQSLARAAVLLILGIGVLSAEEGVVVHGLHVFNHVFTFG